MNAITIYTRAWCPYCTAAKDLLKERGAAFTEIDIETVSTARQEMIQRAKGRTSVPQIFIGERHVGGCDDLYALDDQGGLAPLLNG
jgi:glutaredoxin 3